MEKCILLSFIKLEMQKLLSRSPSLLSSQGFVNHNNWSFLCLRLWLLTRVVVICLALCNVTFLLHQVTKSLATQCGPWTSSIRIIWELARNAESLSPAQTYWIRICLLTKSTGDLHAHYSFRSTDIEKKCSLFITIILSIGR